MGGDFLTADSGDFTAVGDMGGSFSHFGQASATLEEVFSDGSLQLAAQIVTRSTFEPKAQKSGYVNLSRSGRAHAQLHPHSYGVVLVVRESDPATFGLALLPTVPIHSLRGYRGSNKGWLEGTRGTKQPAAAFHVPAELAADADHDGWKEVDALLSYALNK